MDKYDEIRQIIEEAEDDVDFAEFGNGISDEWIVKAEERLNIKLPFSYKWWLRNYGGGEIYGNEIYSIYEMDFDTVVGGDIVYMHELNQKSNEYSENVLVICEMEDAVYCFDISEHTDGDEYPIYEYYTGELYADNFIEFLKKFILELE